MVNDAQITFPVHNLKKVGIPTIKLKGVLITKPTVQYLSPQRVAMHLLVATQENHTIYLKNTTDVYDTVDMHPAYHVLLLANQIDDLTLYAVLKKRTKVSVECMNVSYHLKDCEGKVFTMYRLLVINLTIISNTTQAKDPKI